MSTVKSKALLFLLPLGKKYTFWPTSKLIPLFDFGLKLGFITPGIISGIDLNDPLWKVIGIFCAFTDAKKKLTIIEKDPIMQGFIQKNIAMLNIEGAQVLKLDVFAYLNSCTSTYDFIFAGPPYALGTIDELPKIIVAKKLIKPVGFFVLEHTPRNDYKNFEGYSFQRNYGTTIFSFFVAT